VAASNQNMLTPITNGSAAPSVAQNVPGQNAPAQPALQAQDSSFVATVSTGTGAYMIKFDQSGNTKWTSLGNYQPLMATADGGVIAKSYDTGAVIVFDANGNATGQIPNLPTYSGKAAYQVGSVHSVVPAFDLANIATTFAAVPGGNLTGKNPAAVVHHSFELFWCGVGYGEQGSCAGGSDIVFGYIANPSDSNIGSLTSFASAHPDWVGKIESNLGR
jgi:hypothetical protein